MISFKTKLKIKRILEKINPFIKYRYIFIIFLIILVLAVFGSISGYTAYFYTSEGLSECGRELNTTQNLYEECRTKAASLSSDLQTAQTELSSCLETVSVDLTQCIKDKEKLLNENKELSDFLTNCRVSEATTNVTLMATQIELEQLTKDYNSLVENVAKDICCVRKAAFPSLNLSYYYVSENSIVCTDQHNESLGTKPFSC